MGKPTAETAVSMVCSIFSPPYGRSCSSTIRRYMCLTAVALPPFSDKMTLRFRISTIAAYTSLCVRSLRGWGMERFMVLPLSSQNIMISVFSMGQPSLCSQIAAICAVNAMQGKGLQRRNGLGGKKQVFVGSVRIDL